MSYTTGNGIESSPAVANGVVYVGSVDHNVYALNASTGALLWSFGRRSDGLGVLPADRGKWSRLGRLLRLRSHRFTR
jgi:outer membrane protein assembly factor BamB